MFNTHCNKYMRWAGHKDFYFSDNDDGCTNEAVVPVLAFNIEGTPNEVLMVNAHDFREHIFNIDPRVYIDYPIDFKRVNFTFNLKSLFISSYKKCSYEKRSPPAAEFSDSEQVRQFLENYGRSHPVPSFKNVDELMKKTELELEKSRIQLRYLQSRQNITNALLPTPEVLPSDPDGRPPTESLLNNKFPYIPFQRKTFVNPPLLSGSGEADFEVFKNKVLQMTREAGESITTTQKFKMQKKTFQNLKKSLKDNDLVLVTSDKTNKLLAIDRNAYFNLGHEFIDTSEAYIPTNERTLDEVEKLGNNLVGRLKTVMKLPQSEYERLVMDNTNGGKFYLLIKDHKTRNESGNFPIRPVTGVQSTPTKGVDYVVQQVLTQLLQHVESHLPNKTPILEFVEAFNFSERSVDDLCMFSLDVVNLYGSIPCDQAIPWVLACYEHHKNDINTFGISTELLGEMLRYLCFNYLIRFDKCLFKQTAGVPMGAAFSPAFAILCMHYLETDLKNSLRENTDILLYKRYIDDIIVICKLKPEETPEIIHDRFLNKFNRYNDKIQFTIETVKHDEELPFLDMTLALVQGFGIKAGWYQKSMHSGNTLRADAHMPLSDKKSIATARFDTILRNCNNTSDLNKGVDKMFKQLEKNGYSPFFITACIKKAVHRYNNPQTIKAKEKFREAAEGKVFLPLTHVIEGLKGDIQKEANKKGLPILAINARASKLSQLCPANNPNVRTCRARHCYICPCFEKPNMCLSQNIVYELECVHCAGTYVGKTSRPLFRRLQGHKSILKPSGRSVLYDHLTVAHHDIVNPSIECFKVSILEHCFGTSELAIREAACIDSRKPMMNARQEAVGLLFA